MHKTVGLLTDVCMVEVVAANGPEVRYVRQTFIRRQKLWTSAIRDDSSSLVFAAKFADGAEIEGIQSYQHPWVSNWPV
jgi:hypothetical protein